MKWSLCGVVLLLCGCEQKPVTLEALLVSPAAITVSVGESASIDAVVGFSDGHLESRASSVTWTSSDVTVATVDGGTISALKVGSATLTATDATSGLSQTAQLTVLDAALVQLTVVGRAPVLVVGTGEALSVKGTYSDGTVTDLSARVGWRSSNAPVAAVDASGRLSALAVGQATITATLGTSSATFVVAVVDADTALKSLLVTPATLTLSVGEGTSLEAVGGFANGLTGTVHSLVHWSSSNPAAAQVDSEGAVRALAAGRTTLTATDTSSGLSATCTLTVTEAALRELSVSAPSPALPAGSSEHLSVTGVYSDGSLSDVTARVSWNTSSPAVGTIDATGLATAVAPGNVTYGATLGSVTGAYVVAITEAKLTSLSVTSGTSIPKGLTTQARALGLYTDGSLHDLTSVVVWATSDASLATASNAPAQSGLVTAVSPGPFSITATDPVSGRTASAAATVSSASLVSLEVTHPAALSVLSLALGETVTLGALGHYSDGTTADLTSSVGWTTSSAAILTVTSAGTVSSVAGGNAVLTAATAGGFSASATIHVSPVELRSLAIQLPLVSPGFGDFVALRAIGTYSDGSTADLTSRATWSSRATEEVQISDDPASKGFAWVGLAKGAVPITAKVGELVASAALANTVPTVSSYSFSAAPPSPLPKNAWFRWPMRMNLNGSAPRDLTEATTFLVASPSPGSTATALNTPGNHGQFFLTGPTGGTFSMIIIFPFNLGSVGQGMTLP